MRALSWGLPAVSKEVNHWRWLAQQIPEPVLRQEALRALREKRGQTDGAALFAVLTRSRNLTLLRLLTAYQVIWDYLDSIHERAPTRANGETLHLALQDALDAGHPIRNYYRHHPWSDDGGYLGSLVSACRDWSLALPCYGNIRAFLLREAQRAQVLALNHEPDPLKRKESLYDWARREYPGHTLVRWYELSAASSAGLTIFALLTLSAEPSLCWCELERTYDAYSPWMSALATMLDSYVDHLQDSVAGHHVYIEHYPSMEDAVERIAELAFDAVAAAKGLRYSERHLVIAASMVAMYLSKDSARTPSQRSSTKRIADAGGSLTRIVQ